MRTGLLIIIVAILLLCVSEASAQDSPLSDSLVPASEALHQQLMLFADEGRWEERLGTLEGWLADGKLSRDERSLVRKYLGIFHILLRNEEKAVEVFKDIVRDDVSFEMEDLALEGKKPVTEAMLPFFKAMQEVRREEVQRREERLRRTSKGVASLRSALVPGWGQRYLGHRNRSYIMMGLTGVAVAYAVAADRSYRDARDTYQTAEPGADFDAFYTDYRDKANLADVALGLVAAAWLYNILDAALLSPNIEPAGGGGDSPVGVVPRQGGVALVLHKRF